MISVVYKGPAYEIYKDGKLFLKKSFSDPTPVAGINITDEVYLCEDPNCDHKNCKAKNLVHPTILKIILNKQS